MAFPRAQAANPRCSGKAQPGATALMSWCVKESGCRGARNWGIYNCLAGETEVMTPEGDIPIAELAGTTARVLTYAVGDEGGRGSQRWVDAQIRSYGVQPLRRITLQRGNDFKVIHATPDHRWLTRYRHSGTSDKAGRFGYVERVTDELVAGHTIPTVLPRSSASYIRHLGGGIPHGLVYGDGTLDNTGGARIQLIGEKNLQFVDYFPNQPTHLGASPDGLPTAMITGLSRTWKQLPSLEESSAYLYGFLAGWFAADGRVTKQGSAQLYCVDREALEQARLIARRVGISTMPIRVTKSGGNTVGGNFLEQRDIYSLSFIGSTLDSSFFLIPQHRERWNASKKRRPNAWTVVSVEETDRVEEVFCAEVPGTENFVLADGVLTGNCRSIRGSTNRSIHGDGRAIDVGFSGHSNPEGWKLVRMLLPHVGKLGIQRIIWSRTIWDSRSPNGRYYSGSASHYDHLHIELTWAAARGLNLPTIRAAMRGVKPATVVAPKPKPPPPPPPKPKPKEVKKVFLIKAKGNDAVYVTDLVTKTHVTSPENLKVTQFLLGSRGLPIEVVELAASYVNSIPTTPTNADRLKAIAGTINGVVDKLKK